MGSGFFNQGGITGKTNDFRVISGMTKSILLMTFFHFASGLTVFLPPASAGRETAPPVFIMDGQQLLRVKQAAEKDHQFAEAIENLKKVAEEKLTAGPFSVTDKTGTPPSGDPHDYMSIGPFWWPNPNTEDGLPYIRRDGETNPERSDDTFDNPRAGQMRSAVNSLALAYFFTDHEPYAEHAAKLLRVWFLDTETRMNPHLEYAQAIPGRTEGRGIGIIDTASWIHLIDSIQLLQSSQHWSETDHRGLQEWFARYLHWLKTSDNGLDEQSHYNNHGTWYDAQVLSFALFTDQNSLARQQIQDFTLDRIEQHFEPDGSQPYELARTRSWNYSLYNLRAHFKISRMAEHLKLDLWNWQTEDGKSIRDGLDYLIPYLAKIDQWPHEQIVEPSFGPLANNLLPLAIRAYDDEKYIQAWEKLSQSQQSKLRFPFAILPDHKLSEDLSPPQRLSDREGHQLYPKDKKALKFNAVVFNNNSGTGYDAWIELSPGIAGGWSPKEFLEPQGIQRVYTGQMISIKSEETRNEYQKRTGDVL